MGTHFPPPLQATSMDHSYGDWKSPEKNDIIAFAMSTDLLDC